MAFQASSELVFRIWNGESAPAIFWEILGCYVLWFAVLKLFFFIVVGVGRHLIWLAIIYWWYKAGIKYIPDQWEGKKTFFTPSYIMKRPTAIIESSMRASKSCLTIEPLSAPQMVLSEISIISSSLRGYFPTSDHSSLLETLWLSALFSGLFSALLSEDFSVYLWDYYSIGFFSLIAVISIVVPE